MKIKADAPPRGERYSFIWMIQKSLMETMRLKRPQEYGFSPRFRKWLLAGSLLLGSCGPVAEPPVPHPVDPADAGTPPANACSAVERKSVDCSSGPLVIRLKERELAFGGNGFVRLDQVIYSSYGTPSAVVGLVTPECVFLSSSSIPEGSSASLSGISVALRQGAPKDSGDRWADLQIQDETCSRRCDVVTSTTVTLGMSAPLQLGGQAPGMVLGIKRFDNNIAVLSLDDRNSSLWILHIPLGRTMSADFWTGIYSLTSMTIDVPSGKAELRLEYQSCPPP